MSRFLPRTGWTWLATVKEGGGSGSGAVPVDVPASEGLERRGVWYLIEVGIRGLLVPDERGNAVAYLICEPSSHYYHTMTSSRRMPVLIDQKDYTFIPRVIAVPHGRPVKFDNSDGVNHSVGIFSKVKENEVNVFVTKKDPLIKSFAAEKAPLRVGCADGT